MSRIPCCIPGCTRTMGADTAAKRFGHVPDEWICQPHWSRLSRKERAIWSRMKRQARKFGLWVRPEAADRVWSGLKRRCLSYTSSNHYAQGVSESGGQVNGSGSNSN